MHVPIQVDYGVRALIDLAEHAGEGAVRTAQIADRKGIPEPFLHRVLLSLSKHGLVCSYRGPRGGYVLAKPPADISMGMVMAYLGGTQTLVNCLDDIAFCGQSPGCSQRNIWRTVEEAVVKILDSTTIADLVEDTRTNQGAGVKSGGAEPMPVAWAAVRE